ncbi:glomulin-like [Bacillus rossius redtenbacheri]|uniref:glomulin-like n=1 Tax=Bacillus rossius redtenbacheri TaxID=93214 RepID=UPI002FDD2615
MLYYLLLGEGVNLDSVPLVYDVLYVFQRVLYLAAFLLRQPSHLLVHKGLRLASAVLVRLPRGEVPSELLDPTNHKHFAQSLCNILIYSEQKENRLSALKILKMYLFTFDHKGRYLLMCNLPEVCNHDGAMELLVVTFKDMIYEANNGGGAPCSKYFMGGHLRSLLLSLSALTHGVESDLVETAKQILASLNLVSFLILYDKEGLLGVREALPELEQRLLEPLKQGITLSRDHYELKLKDLKEEYVQNVKLKDSRVPLTVGEKILPNLPMERKVTFLKSALQCFDLMEFSLGQVHDCMRELSLKKLKTSNKFKMYYGVTFICILLPRGSLPFVINMF